MIKFLDISKWYIITIICSILVSHNVMANSYAESIEKANKIIDKIEQGEEVSQGDLEWYTNTMDKVEKIDQSNMTEETKDLYYRHKSSQRVFDKCQDIKIKAAEAKVKALEAAAKNSRVASNNTAYASLGQAMQNHGRSSNNTKTMKDMPAEIAKAKMEVEKLKSQKSPISACSGENRCYPGCRFEKVESCTLCPLFVVVFNTVSEVGALSSQKFTGGIIQIVIVFFAIWLAVETMKFVYTMKTKDLKDFVQTLINRGFVIILVVTILSTGIGNFYNIFIKPVYNTAQSMAQIMFDDGHGIGTHKDDKKAQKERSLSDIKEIKDGLPSTIGISIVKTMTMMENRVRQIKALGAALVCQSIKDGWGIFAPRLLIYGSAIWVLTVAIIIMVPFIMIDSVFQLGVATAIMPFAVGAYAFEITKKHCASVWNTFLNSAFSFLFTSAVVIILLGAIQTLTQEGIGSLNGFNDMFVIGNANGDNVYTKFKDGLEIFSPMFLNMVFVFLLAWAVMNTGKDFAKKFAGSISSTSIGSDIGTRFGSTAVGMGKKFGTPGARAALKGASWAGNKIKKGAHKLVARGRTAMFNRRFKNNASVVTKTNKDGTRTKTYTKDAEGNITKTINKEKKMGFFGRRKKLVTEQEIRTKNGIIKQTTTKIMAKKGDQWVEVNSKVEEKFRPIGDINVMNKDGTFNPEAMAKILEGTSGKVREKLLNNMVRSINESRFSKGSFNLAKENLAKAPETSVDPKTGEIITKYITKDGEVIFSKTKLRADGIVESKLTRVSKSGKVLTLESDGIRNKMSNRVLKGGVDATNMSLDEIENNYQKDKNGKILERVAYSYSEYYKKQLAAGAMKESDIPDGMFMQTDQNGITRDEYGEIVKDAYGNIIGGSFKRYRAAARNDTSIFGKNYGVGNYGEEHLERGENESRAEFRKRKRAMKEQVSENKKELGAESIFGRTVNDMSSSEADMNYYFTNSKSPRRTKNIRGWF